MRGVYPFDETPKPNVLQQILNRVYSSINDAAKMVQVDRCTLFKSQLDTDLNSHSIYIYI